MRWDAHCWSVRILSMFMLWHDLTIKHLSVQPHDEEVNEWSCCLTLGAANGQRTSCLSACLMSLWGFMYKAVF